jgi:D-glycero-D-manno-heptose 1,7-bisphosphate phosphatase
MYREAAAALALDFDQSWFVGDKLSDVGAAEVLGGCGILVRTGYGAEVEGEAPSHVPVVDDLATAVRHIIDRTGR